MNPIIPEPATLPLSTASPTPTLHPTPEHDIRCKAAGAPRAPRRGQRRTSSASLAVSAEEELRVLEILMTTLTAHNESLDDPEVMLALAEGETSLLELLDALLETDLNDEGLIEGLKRNKDTIAVRLHRIEERRQSRRAILEQALLLIQTKTLERPIATITLSDRAPNLVVEEEAQIPARFFDLKPVLNRRRAKEALEAGEVLSGARLSNGSVTLTVRRR